MGDEIFFCNDNKNCSSLSDINFVYYLKMVKYLYAHAIRFLDEIEQTLWRHKTICEKKLTPKSTTITLRSLKCSSSQNTQGKTHQPTTSFTSEIGHISGISKKIFKDGWNAGYTETGWEHCTLLSRSCIQSLADPGGVGRGARAFPRPPDLEAPEYNLRAKQWILELLFYIFSKIFSLALPGMKLLFHILLVSIYSLFHIYFTF